MLIVALLQLTDENEILKKYKTEHIHICKHLLQTVYDIEYDKHAYLKIRHTLGCMCLLTVFFLCRNVPYHRAILSHDFFFCTGSSSLF